MLGGFEKIIENRIRAAQKKGVFENLPGGGKPLQLEDDRHVPEDLRLAYKILKNADFVPPEIELKKEIIQAEDLLASLPEGPQKYKLLKRINFLIMRLNAMRDGSIQFDWPQKYVDRLGDRMSEKPTSK